MRAQAQTQIQIQTQEEINTILNHLSSQQSRNKALEQFTVLLSNKSPLVIIQLLSNEFDNANPGNKEILVLLPLFFASNQHNQIAILESVLGLLNKSIIVHNTTIFEFIAKIYGQIVNLFCNSVGHNNEILSTAHHILYTFCLDTINHPSIDMKKEGIALLIELIENSLIVKEGLYIKLMWKTISAFLDDKKFKYKAYAIKCLSTLIYSAEDSFQPYANNALYKILDYLPDSDWVKRKHSLNVVYTLCSYCLEQITPLMDDIIEFLNVLKNDKVPEVREICIQTLELFQESINQSSQISKRANRIDSSFTNHKKSASVEGGQFNTQNPNFKNETQLNTNNSLNNTAINNMPMTSKFSKKRNLSFNMNQSCKNQFINKPLYNSLYHNNMVSESNANSNNNDMKLMLLKNNLIDQNSPKDMGEERPMTPVNPTLLNKVFIRTPLDNLKPKDIISKSMMQSGLDINHDSRNTQLSQPRHQPPHLPHLQGIINEKACYTDRVMNTNIQTTTNKQKPAAMIPTRREAKKKPSILFEKSNKIKVNKPGINSSTCNLNNNSKSNNIFPPANIIISEYANKNKKNHSSIERINIINNINNNTSRSSDLNINTKPNHHVTKSAHILTQHSPTGKHDQLIYDLAKQIKLMNEKQNSLIEAIEKIEFNSKMNYSHLDSRISSLEIQLNTLLTIHSESNTLKQIENYINANDFSQGIPMMMENSSLLIKSLQMIKKKQIAKIPQHLIETLLAKILEAILLGQNIDTILDFILRVLNEKMSIKNSTKKKIKESMEFLMNNKQSIPLDDHCFSNIRSIISHSFNKY